MALSYLSKSGGIGGAIKTCPEDFIVEEIAPDGTVFELDKEPAMQAGLEDAAGKFTHFILQKRDWSTTSAISEIAHRIRVTDRLFNVAGNKDKAAITTQLASVIGDKREALSSLSIKDIKINGVWAAGERVHMGSLLGNRFTITVRNASERNPGLLAEMCGAVSGELGGVFPNYFGEQRFGSSRKNTAKVGLMVLQGRLEDAAMSFLSYTEGESHAEARLAREELASNQDFARALKTFPRHLRLERTMLAHLSKRKDDFAGAFRALPRSTLLMFIHAVQSQMFNNSLSQRIEEGPLELEMGEYFCGETLGFPDTSKTGPEGWVCGKLIGYQTPLNQRESAVLESAGLKKDDFRVKALPEINSKGAYRTLLAPMKDFNLSVETSDAAGAPAAFRFSLPSGSYATVAMREFTKNDNL
jgi:tRNA pseudouridine13 synthase